MDCTCFGDEQQNQFAMQIKPWHPHNRSFLLKTRIEKTTPHPAAKEQVPNTDEKKHQCQCHRGHKQKKPFTLLFVSFVAHQLFVGKGTENQFQALTSVYFHLPAVGSVCTGFDFTGFLSSTSFSIFPDFFPPFTKINKSPRFLFILRSSSRVGGRMFSDFPA